VHHGGQLSVADSESGGIPIGVMDGDVLDVKVIGERPEAETGALATSSEVTPPPGDHPKPRRPLRLGWPLATLPSLPLALHLL
jgi:hypothetical protein